MGVDVSHIIKHSFRHVEDIEASLAFAKETIGILRNKLFISEPEESFFLNQVDCDGQMETTFSLPFYDLDFTLHNGFWQIESYYHYIQILVHNGGDFWLRCRIFDIVRALGQEEAWHAKEYYTWNGHGCEEPMTTFEEWMERTIDKLGKPIPEFNQEHILACGGDCPSEYEDVYHDSFKECKETFERLQSGLPDYKLLGLARTRMKYLRCEKSGNHFLVNEKTLESMFDYPMGDIVFSLNGPEMVVKIDDESAVFDSDGNQLTEFVKGTFDWKWAPYDSRKTDSVNKRIIYNEQAGIELPPR